MQKHTIEHVIHKDATQPDKQLTNPDAKLYSTYNWAPAGMYQYRLECVSIQGTTETYKQLTAPVTIDPNGIDFTAVSNAGIDAAVADIEDSISSIRGQQLSAQFN